MRTVADVLAESLAEAGVLIVFGLPGGENTEVLDAIRRQGIDFVLVHNESSAVFMADTVARLTGTLGVCLTTLGPGAANACVGVAHAFLERSPVLIITAQSIGRLIGRHTHQIIDIQAIFAPITKLTAELTPNETRRTVRQALAVATDPRPGPVHLGINSENASLPVVDDDPTPQAPRSARKQSLPEDAVTAARKLLAQAQRPAIVAGLGLEPEKPYNELRRLAEFLDAPVIVTPKAKGALPDDHPLSAGTIGLTRTDPVYELLAESDCILAVGYDVVELVKPWDEAAPLIWAASWPNDDPAIRAEVELVGELGRILDALTPARPAEIPDWGADRVAAFHRVQNDIVLPSPMAGRMRPQSVLAALRAATPRDILVTTDVGSHKILTALSWPAYEPNRYLVSNGLSAMGFGLTAAIAAAYVLKEPVVAITGDAGLAMVMGELGPARRLNLPVIVVVMNDSALDLIRSAQRRNDKPVYGTEFANPDFAAIAAAYGIGYQRVASEQDATIALRSAIDKGDPALIDARIDPASYPTTPRKAISTG